jgi:glucose/arabinose dehydrogenase
MTERARAKLLLVPLLWLAACDTVQTGVAGRLDPQAKGAAEPYQARGQQVMVRAVVENLDSPWDMAFVSERRILVTEKPGRLLLIDLDGGERQAVRGVPEVAHRSQGGLLGVVLHPGFADNGLLYLSYAADTGDGQRSTRLMRARLEGTQLRDKQVLFTAEPFLDTTKHYGGALVFDRDGYLYLSVGDRGRRHNAQDPGGHLGKILRFTDSGDVPADNPFVAEPGARPEIYSWGHRNPQGLAIHPQTGDLWAAEHGPRGGDEVNLVRAGRNYGWPVITYGEEYRGGKIGEGTAKPGMEQPVKYYLPSIGTAGIAFYVGDEIPGWRNNLFVSGLVYTRTHLSRLVLEDDRVVDEESLFEHLQMRIRNVASSPGGQFYVLSENGTLFRVDAAD